MEHLNKFNIVAGIKNFTALLKSKYILLLIQHLKAVKCVVTVIICVAPYIEIKISCPKESSLIGHVQNLDHYIIIFIITAVVKKNSNFRNFMILAVRLRIVPLVIEATKEARCNVLYPLISFKFSPSIN